MSPATALYLTLLALSLASPAHAENQEVDVPICASSGAPVSGDTVKLVDWYEHGYCKADDGIRCSGDGTTDEFEAIEAEKLAQESSPTTMHREFLSSLGYCEPGVSYQTTLSAVLKRMQETSQARHELTNDELVAIYFYTGDGYTCINSALREGGRKEVLARGLFRALKSGLEKLPPYRGTVTRKVTLPKNVFFQHIAGHTIYYSALTSTSAPGGNFDDKGESIDFITIHSKTGRKIEGFTGLPGEQEVLILPARFKVVSVKRHDGTADIVLDEIDSSTWDE